MAVNTQATQAAGSISQTYLAQGNAAMRAGNYSQALSLFEQALKQSPALAKVIEFNIKLAKSKLSSGETVSVLKSPVLAAKNNVKPTVVERTPTQAVQNIPVKVVSSYEGRLEKNDQGALRGWAVNKSKPAEIFELSVLVDDVFFCKVKNYDNRADLQRAGKSAGRGGYSLVIPQDILDADAHTVSISYPDGSVLTALVLEGVTNTTPNDIVLLPVDEKVSVIVPIYNAVDDVKVCIERLRKYTNKDVDVILINDASPDKAINPLLEDAVKESNFRVYHNDKNLGFTKTVNRGIELAGTNDVILLNSDARVTPRWIQGFKRALATDHKIATVTAMSDRAGAFSAPNIGNDNDLPPGIKEEEYAVAFRRRAVGYYPTVPTGNGFCMYIRRSCINEIGGLDAEAFPRGYGEENDFCMRARAAGWRNVIDDRTYVFHDRSKSFGGQKDELIKAGRAVVDSRYPDYKKATSVFSESPLINLARFKARHAIHDCNEQILPRGLFVISTLTGGTPQTNRDLMLALADRVEGWLLHCDKKVMSLYRVYKDQPDKLIRQHILKEQVEVLTHYCAEYDRVISNWLFEYDFEFVHIRHLAWHSLSLPRLAKMAGAKVINSFHDFYTLCPTVKLLDGDDKYCDGNCTKESSNACKPDLWGTDSLPTLKNAWVKNWREKFSRALSYCDVFITTHDSVRETILEHLAIPAENFHVIPHGRDFDKFYQLAEPYKDGEVLKILVPGNVSTPKGSKIIEQLLALDTEGKLHFHILGKSNIKFSHPRLTFHGEYKRDEFAEHVKKIRPHIGAVLSIWNETWCHTLTELWSVGIPVIVTDFKTIATRVRVIDGGWVVKVENINDLYHKIKNEVMSSSEVYFKSCNVSEAQLSTLCTYQNKQMSDSYINIYNQLSINFNRG
ncbi:GT2 family glycosyltransferase/glycosyltransferase involved in cell wall biosynthesis [Rheinheimera pacifica]|uniref:glycosyltransferase n=1 Tax=Rheinheimera pacifica TaxID=173990 RepID=UPI0028554000|nr:glycosyltransferase [Rheinheimera pacifica]MDR6984040.1 GT2 family glycosyltransferase/glycosyltransferase involved in cell wall biosynthesis [Rheinheimera pacifica]